MKPSTVICFLCVRLIHPVGTWPETSLNVSLVAESGMSHPVSRPLQPGLRFYQLRSPARHGSALRLSCPEGRRDRVPTFRMVDPVGDVGVPCTPVALQVSAGTL